MSPVSEDIDEYDETIIDTVRRHCDPEQIWIFFHIAEDESDDWYLCSDVQVCIVIRGGDEKRIWGDVLFDLAVQFIDAFVKVYTVDEFEDWKTCSGTAAYDAVETGYLAYEKEGDA